MERNKITTLWKAHSPAGKWALTWLGIHLAVIALIALLMPGNSPALARLAISGLAVGLNYLLARRGLENYAAVFLCLILTVDFHLSVIVNYANGIQGNDLLTIASLGVIFTAWWLLGRPGIITFAGLGGLLLFMGLALFEPGQYLAGATYLTAVAVIYLVFEQRDRLKDQGIIDRYDTRSDHIAIRLETRRGDILRVRTTKSHFRQLSLQTGDYIIIDRGINRSENGQQYIQALSIRKTNNQS